MYFLPLNKQMRAAAVMISIFKVIGVLSYGCLLGLGFGTTLHAADKPSAPEGMTTESGSGIETIKGEVVRLKGQHFYLRQSDGKERHLHAKPTTEMERELKKGDRIQVQADDQHNAMSIRQTK